MRNMKMVIVVCFLSLLSTFGCAQYTLIGPGVILEGTKLEYEKGEVIKFLIKNELGVRVQVQAVALEVYDSTQHEWFSQVGDLLNLDCSEFAGINGFVMEPHSSRQILWEPKKANPNKCFNYKSNVGRYLISFKWKKDNDTSELIKYYSSEFMIE